MQQHRSALPDCAWMPTPDQLLSWHESRLKRHAAAASLLDRGKKLYYLARLYAADLSFATAKLAQQPVPVNGPQNPVVEQKTEDEAERSGGSDSVSSDFMRNAEREDQLGQMMQAREGTSFSAIIHSRALFDRIQADINREGRLSVQLDPTGETADLVQLLALLELAVQQDKRILRLRLVYWSNNQPDVEEFYARARHNFESALYAASLKPSRERILELALRMHAGVQILLGLDLYNPISEPERLEKTYRDHKDKILTYYATSQK